MLASGMAVQTFLPEKNRKSKALGLGVYRSLQVARLSGVPLRSLGYWRQTRLIVPRIEKGEPGHPALYTYADLRELRVVQQLRRQGLILPRIRRAIKWLQPQVRGRISWAEEYTLRTDGDHVFTLLPATDGASDLVAADLSGQKLAIAVVGDIVQQFASDPDLAHLREFAQWVDIRPDVMAGAPVVRRTRIATSLVYSLATNGWTERMILDAYPTLTPTGLEKAVKFEETVSLPEAA